jgi:hypothetical protein
MAFAHELGEVATTATAKIQYTTPGRESVLKIASRPASHRIQLSVATSDFGRVFPVR